MDRCDGCGFDYEEHGRLQLAADLAGLGARYGERLRGTVGDVEEGALRRRPEPQVWSALEYACHVRDVFLVQRERLFLALVEDCPSFAPMYREQRVTLARYAAEDPTRVADQLHMAATLVGETFRGIDDAGWRRECICNFPAPARRSVAWLGAHTLHEGEHHLGDLDRAIAAVS